MAAALSPTFDERGPYTAEELADFPRMAFGHDLDRVLHLSEAERKRLVEALVGRIDQVAGR